MKLILLNFSLILILGVFFLIPLKLTLAQDTMTTFQTIPFVDGEVLNTETYIKMLYRLAIAAASFLVVFKIIVAGARLTVSDSVSGRGEAKKDIQGALLGLLIILGAVTILNTINPNLTNLNFLRSAAPTVINNTSFQTSSEAVNAQKKEIMEQGLSVQSVYKGVFGTPEHIAFIKKCSGISGKPIGNPNEKIVECYK